MYIMILSFSMTFSFIRSTNESSTRSYVCLMYIFILNFMSVFDIYLLINLGNVLSNFGLLCMRIMCVFDFILAFFVASSFAISTSMTSFLMMMIDFFFVMFFCVLVIFCIFVFLFFFVLLLYFVFNMFG